MNIFTPYIQHNFFAHLLALIAALVLSACGGGAGQGLAKPAQTPDKSPAANQTEEVTPADNTVAPPGLNATTESEADSATHTLVDSAPESPVVNTTIIENFEDSVTLAYWTFHDGKEYPGASGSLSSGAGHLSNAGLRLNHDFQCIVENGTTHCGRYVSADYTPPERIEPGAAIRIMVRSPAEIEMGLRVVDESGQTLQYRLSRPLEARHADAWYPVVASLKHPYHHWNGANDGVLNGRIKTLSILANVHAGLHPIAGSVAIDDIAMLDSFDATHLLDRETTALTSVAPTAAELGARVGVAFHGTRHKITALDNAKSAGIAFIRSDLWWTKVEKPTALGSYDFSFYDDLVEELEKRGMGALFILPPKYDATYYDVLKPEGVAAYAKFAKAAAQHYAGRNVRFEIVNEPDHPAFWHGTSEQYFELCKAGIDAVRQGNPAAQVSTGGLSWFDFAYLKKELASGAAAHADAVALHGYRSTPETLAGGMLLADTLIQKFTGKHLPIWNTEWGFSLKQLGFEDGHLDAFRHRQAVMLARAMLTQWSADMPMAVWYDMVDDGPYKTNNEHNFGLLDVNYNEKPAIVALRQFSTWAQGRINNGLMQDLPHGLHIMKLTGPDDTVFIAWNSEPKATVHLRVPASGSPSIVNLLGVPVAGTPGGSGANAYREFTLGENGGPVYIRYAKAG